MLPRTLRPARTLPVTLHPSGMGRYTSRTPCRNTREHKQHHSSTARTSYCATSRNTRSPPQRGHDPPTWRLLLHVKFCTAPPFVLLRVKSSRAATRDHHQSERLRISGDELNIPRLHIRRVSKTIHPFWFDHFFIPPTQRHHIKSMLSGTIASVNPTSMILNPTTGFRSPIAYHTTSHPAITINSPPALIPFTSVVLVMDSTPVALHSTEAPPAQG